MTREVLIQSNLALRNMLQTSFASHTENENEDTFENAGKNVIRAFNMKRMKWQVGQWVDFKDMTDKWEEAQIVDRRPYSKSAGNFIDEPFDDSDSDSIDKENRFEIKVQYCQD
jgi:hypothetical protein